MFGGWLLSRVISFGSDFAYFNNNLFSYTYTLATFWNANPIMQAAPGKDKDDIINDILNFDYEHNDLIIVQWNVSTLDQTIQHCMDFIQSHHHTKKRNFHINTGDGLGFDIVCNWPNTKNNQLRLAERIKHLAIEPNSHV